MGFIMDAIEDVGDFISDTVEAVIDNPLGAIVSVGGMALGIPPIYAGALGGAANAAANDGDILKGALTGGAMGYVGGAAGQAAANAGAGAALSGAAGGAAAGAAGAALTGNNILEGAFTGGVLGGATGYIKSEFFSPDTGTYTRTYDDGSTLEYTPDGNVVGSSPATDTGTQAPVYEYNPSNGEMELVSGNGNGFKLNELTNEQTQDLINRNVSPGMIDNLVDTGAGTDQPYRVEIEGAAGTSEAPQYAKTEFRTPGTDLATWDQIDAGQATWNAAANAWEAVTPNYDTFQPTDTNFGAFGEQPTGGTTTQPVTTTPTTYTFDDGSTITIGANGQTTITDAIGITNTTTGGNSYASEGGGKTTVFDDGSWMTVNPDGSSVVADSSGKVTTHSGGTVTGPATGGTATDLADMGTIEIVDTRPTTTTPVTTPVTTTPTTTLPVVTPPTTTIPYDPVNPVTPVTPIFPVITPTTPTTPVTPTTPTTPGTGGYNPTVNPMSGLNPGLVNPTAFYKTTSPAQSQFSWGARSFQPGPQFDSKLYNSAPAPQTPWGIQNIAKPLTPQEVTQAYQGQPIVRPPLPVAQRYEAAMPVTGPVAPV